MTSVEAAALLGQLLAVLEHDGVTDFMGAGQALLYATPAGATPERHAALDAYREARDAMEATA